MSLVTAVHVVVVYVAAVYILHDCSGYGCVVRDRMYHTSMFKTAVNMYIVTITAVYLTALNVTAVYLTTIYSAAVKLTVVYCTEPDC